VLAKSANIWLLGQHVADMSATFPAKSMQAFWVQVFFTKLDVSMQYCMLAELDEEVKIFVPLLRHLANTST
jgi:hypothetical protein